MKKLRLGEFERNSLVVFAITMIANVLSYLYQIVMGNMLTPADWRHGEYAAVSFGRGGRTFRHHLGIDGDLYSKISRPR